MPAWPMRRWRARPTTMAKPSRPSARSASRCSRAVEDHAMTTSADPVGLVIANGVARIRFQRPEVLNAINVRTALCLRDAVYTAIRDASVRVIVLSGEGRAFVAGGDLAYFRD